MEIRVLRYFLEIARAGSMSRAAETLHVSQPTLSKQMKDLEGELGRKLFRRGSTSLSLTDEGMLLRKRAEDILDMVDKTADEFKALDDIMGGEVQIGCAESYQIKYLAQAIQEFKKKISSVPLPPDQWKHRAGCGAAGSGANRFCSHCRTAESVQVQLFGGAWGRLLGACDEKGRSACPKRMHPR